MLRRMIQRQRVTWGIGLALGIALSGCGGQAELELSPRGSELPVPLAPVPPAPSVDAGVVMPEPPRPPEPEPPAPFDDPGCPPPRELPDILECDPLAAPTGCPEGESCFPFVSYPRGPCGVERFGTLCEPAGAGTQGDSCARERCAAEHICVSTGRGTQCVRLCSIGDGAPDMCAPGLLCLPIDIEGFGGCL